MKKVNFTGWPKIIMNRLYRPFQALLLLLSYRNVAWYIYKRFGARRLISYIYVTFFVRGEDCGLSILDPVWKLFPFLIPYPPDIELEVTTFCPLHCKICERTYWNRKEGFLNKHMTFEQFKHIIDQFPNLKWINMTGEGDAFTNPDIMKMIEYVKKKNVYVVIVHEFFTMNEEMARRLVELGVERFWISFDGATKKTYESIRVGSDYDRVINNIKLFQRIKKRMNSPIPELCLRFVFFKNNYYEMEKYIDLADSLGIKFVNFVGLLEFKQIKGWEYEPSEELINKVNLKAREKGIKVIWSHASHDPNIKVPLHYCVAFSEPYIFISGDVIPCCALNMLNKREWLSKRAFGNLFKQHFKDIWNSPRYKKFRRMVVKKDAPVPLFCLGCRAFDSTKRKVKYGVDYDL